STVYRTLQKFKDLGLVDVFHFDEDHQHFEAKNASEHHHLMCIGCGSVIEFEYDLINSIRTEIPEAADFDIKRAELRVTGYCSNCRGKDVQVSTDKGAASSRVKEEIA
ncbi:MAG TPA: transcriptional repressor, partial [Dehalococcoidia bacterium]|nr:transcriptional repressor [Dehalococcoidia bacterium]